MKKILITGANSYIGTSFEKWLTTSNDNYMIHTLDVKNNEWKTHDFSNYNSIFHVAAIVHKNEKNVESSLYYQVNRDLPFAIAKKAKEAGVPQFIFLSSMSVYGDGLEIINDATPLKPQSHYAKSKFEAEELLTTLVSDQFNLVILRPPMVYGPKATGNYTRLSKLSKLTPIFPNINNQRSMIFIDNLSEFIKKAVDLNLSGLYFPQNKEYVNTSNLVKEIRFCHNRKTLLTHFFNPIILSLTSIKPLSKLFGNLTYDKKLSSYDFNYQVVNFEESVKKSEQ
ncbi:NAD-dependent epimerase/dehydratase family protein [Streptococcus sp. CSL10205-OR2]|uniref:NAD-dependent epimerase/dehydratase family protein n=1 Tax=Streptococcus sp. CSL10205-OR2 TaxID=2980558 RepID=UPI0021DB6396|nr:NAD-dependent epimerase/dehydratase family protein [Streptococcus sp. CSL10205-OR2]MCU9533606.1 NAD-dependent epimerase/dehydratase family protein [Streptococcus sp. CSL10205-OR2]